MKKYAITHTTADGYDQTLLVTGFDQMMKLCQAIDDEGLTVTEVILTEWTED